MWLRSQSIFINKFVEGGWKIKNRVAVLLGYFNGQAFIKEQLNSIFNQSGVAVSVFVYDDHSEKPFSSIELNMNSQQASSLTVRLMPETRGFAQNFLNGLKNIEDEFEYFALSDQDDIWYEDKLEKAISQLAKTPSHIPSLYCASTEIVDATATNSLGFSPIFLNPPSFKNALVQNIAGGNTFVLNKAAKSLVVKASSGVYPKFHDWWIYQIVSGAEGHVFYDRNPCLKYRQHSQNLIGANTHWKSRLTRFHNLIQGRFRTMTDNNLKALQCQKDVLTNANLLVLKDFVDARQSSLVKRLFLFKRSGVYRHTLFGNLSLLLGILLNKI